MINVLVPLLAKQAGDKGTATQAENIAHGDHQGKHRRTQRHTGHQVGIAGFGDKIGVHHIVHQRHHHTQHHRQRQLKESLTHRHLLKQGVLLLHIRVSFYLLLYYT